MKRFYLVENSGKTDTEKAGRMIEERINTLGGICFRGSGYIDTGSLPERLDCIITLGGDGTLIRAAMDIAGMDIPLIGVNMGHLGYLTGISSLSDIDRMLHALIDDNYLVEKRMMLEGRIYDCKGAEKTKRRYALNELVVARKCGVRTIKCNVYVNGEFLNEYTSDGIIISTPTGSTAYNLSAGGPIAEPGARISILTPICTHALNQRSMVFSSEADIEIKLCSGEGSEAIAVFDGSEEINLEGGDRISVSEAPIVTRLIKLEGGTFVDNLRNKMNGI